MEYLFIFIAGLYYILRTYCKLPETRIVFHRSFLRRNNNSTGNRAYVASQIREIKYLLLVITVYQSPPWAQKHAIARIYLWKLLSSRVNAMVGGGGTKVGSCKRTLSFEHKITITTNYVQSTESQSSNWRLTMFFLINYCEVKFLPNELAQRTLSKLLLKCGYLSTRGCPKRYNLWTLTMLLGVYMVCASTSFGNYTTIMRHLIQNMESKQNKMEW